VEALAGAISGSFNNFLVGHIEGGELSGTIDELIRHSVTKLSHIHFVANEEAKRRLIQMGEKNESIYIIGSPDIDVMISEKLPPLEDVLKRYGLNFKEYAVLTYHPVTTELGKIRQNIKETVDALLESNFNYIVIYPNNDIGSEIILNEYKRLEGRQNFKLFPSIQFESFLVILKNCKFVIGNSSAGIREAPIYAIPSVNLGSRQKNRFHCDSIFNIPEEKKRILEGIKNLMCNDYRFSPCHFFGNGKSVEKFMNALTNSSIWDIDTQKQFVDM
jgi:UDP-N-acetylglucosamine 2-epimerase (hydrolysing)